MPQNYNLFHTTTASSFLQNKSHLISEKLTSPVIKEAIRSSGNEKEESLPGHQVPWELAK